MKVTYKKAERSSQISCRVKDSLKDEILKLGKPGKICSAMIREFFKIKKHEQTIGKESDVVLGDGSSIYFVNTKEGLFMNIKQGGQAIVLPMNEENASHVVSKLTGVINIK